MSELDGTVRRHLARAVLRSLGVGKTESQEDAVMSIIGALDSLGVINAEKALDLASHGPATVHIGSGELKT